jgi:hypothetical protein
MFRLTLTTAVGITHDKNQKKKTHTQYDDIEKVISDPTKKIDGKNLLP